MNRAVFKLETWFLDELLPRLDEERRRREAKNEPLGRSKLDRELKNIDDKPYGEHTIPSRENLEILIQDAFWASLQREESQSLRFTISYVKPLYNYDYVLTFEKPLPFDIRYIAKLAPAVKEPEATMLVYPNTDGMINVWGICDFNHSLLSIKVLDPGRLIVSFGAKSIAVIAGYESIFINETVHERSVKIWSKLGPKLRDGSTDDNRVTIILDALRSMRTSGHGGTLLIVPEGNKWKEVITSMNYSGASPLRTLHNLVKEWEELVVGRPGLTGLLDRLRENTDRFGRMAILHPEFERVAKSLAQLTSVDGATIVTPNLEIIGFGAKIKYDPKDIAPLPIYKIDSLEDAVLPISLTDLGGMRHQSAAHFVSEQHDAIALVLSEDGNLSAFVWEEDSETSGLMAYTQLELILF